MKLETKFLVVAFYHFVRLDDVETLRNALLEICSDNCLIGTILIAEEGLNATIAGKRNGIDNLLSYLASDNRFINLVYKESHSDKRPFKRLRIKRKREIVSMGVPDTDPKSLSGIKVDAQKWNELLKDPRVLTIDTRNEYEFEIGSFKGALSPGTGTFRQFPKFVDSNLDPEKHTKVAMFCTGGIRCEKASNYLLKQGFKEVYHLDGGILKYLETVDQNESLWVGECFVFDDRVTINKALAPGSYSQCSACRRPLSDSDRESSKFEQGISCPYCYGKISIEKLSSLKERQRQYELAKIRHRESSKGERGE